MNNWQQSRSHQSPSNRNNKHQTNYHRVQYNKPLQGNQFNTQTPTRTDDVFYNTLKNFKPMCYSGNGVPIFMSNQKWYYSLPCMLILNGLIVLVIVLSLLKESSIGGIHNNHTPSNTTKYIIVNIIVLVLINIFYFLTQFLNPGIRNFSQISQQTYSQKGEYFCVRCNGNRTGEMEHCPDCNICVTNMDHHCGFFNKCIAGNQTYAFYGFLGSVFIGFLSIMVTLISKIPI